MKKLTLSQAHYIKAIHELSFNCDGGVRVCDISEKLHLSKASVSLAMTKLEQKRLVIKDAERHIHLTNEGECEAVRMLNTFEIIWKFLVNILNVDKEAALYDACAMEHVISVDTLCAICRFTGKKDSECATNCPMSIEKQTSYPKIGF